jgi:hypothetical protein
MSRRTKSPEYEWRITRELSGLFDEWLNRCGDEEKYPHGPPSHITRQIIDNFDTPVRTWLRNKLFLRGARGSR